MNLLFKRIFLLTSLIALTCHLSAQQVGTNSPYGRYGIGILSNPAVGSSESMGGISYGLRRSQHVNPGNPASYSKLDTLTFIFDLGASFTNTTFNDDIHNQNLYNGSLEYVAMQFPLFKNMGASIGLLPYSKVGYSFGRPRSTTDLVYQESFNGSGGISEVYGGISYAPNKYLSLGVNMGFLFGSNEYNRIIPVIEGNSFPRYNTTKFYTRALKFDIGVQATYPLDKNRSITWGAVYTPPVNLKSDITILDRNMSTAYTSTADIIKNDTIKDQEFTFPHSFGTGFTYTTKNLLVGIDGTYQLWKDAKYPGMLDHMDDANRYNNHYRINAGIEYVKDPFNRSFFNRIRYRAGGYFGNSYTNVNVFDTANNKSLGVGGFKEYGVTLGLGLPFRDNFNGRVSMINLGFGYSRLQPDMKYMVKEDQFKVSLSMNINEFWFFKRQFD